MAINIYNILMATAFISFILFLSFSRRNDSRDSRPELYLIDLGIKTFGAVATMGLSINLLWFGVNGDFYPNVDLETIKLVSLIGGLVIGAFFLYLMYVNTFGVGKS